MGSNFKKKVHKLLLKHEELLSAKNKKVKNGNSVFDRYKNPILTAAHTPVIWRYDLDEQTKSFSDGAHRHECYHESRSDEVERQIHPDYTDGRCRP